MPLLKNLFMSSTFAVLFMGPLAHTTHAQGMFEENATPEQAAEENKVETHDKDMTASWTKQQLARSIVEATSPIFTIADVKSEADLEKVQKMNADTKNTQQANMEATFTRAELLALYKFYASPDGGSIGAKLGGIQKNRILEKLK